jgi:hypothetical protein
MEFSLDLRISGGKHKITEVALINNNIKKYATQPQIGAVFMQTHELFQDMGFSISYTHFHNISFFCNAICVHVPFMTNFQIPWPEYASKLYRPSDGRFSINNTFLVNF